MEENTTIKKLNTRKKAELKVSASTEKIKIKAEADIGISDNNMSVGVRRALVDESVESVSQNPIQKPQTMEELKKDPEYVDQIRNLAANIDAMIPNRWINYKRYSKHFPGVDYHSYMSLINTLKEFDLAVVKNHRNEIRFKIDLSHEAELSLIDADISTYETLIKNLKKRKTDVKKLITDDKKKK